MDKMVSLMGRGKWIVLAAALVACGGANVQSIAGAPAEAAAGSAAAGANSSPEAGSGGDHAAAGAAGEINMGDAGRPAVAGSSGAAASGDGGAPNGGGSSGGPASQAGAAGAQAGDAAGGSSGALAGGSGGAAAGAANQAGAGAGGAATTCQCATGQCCDGCNFRPNTYRVGLGVVSMGCNVAQQYLVTNYLYLNCTGSSATDVVWGSDPDVDFKEVACSSIGKNACWDPCTAPGAFGLMSPFCPNRYAAGEPLPAVTPACL